MSTARVNHRQPLGRWAEAFATDYVARTLGWLVVCRNWRSRFGELDLIAQDGDVLVVVEVRVRSNAQFGPYQAAVDEHKANRVRRLVPALLHSLDWPQDAPVRLDVIVMAGDGERVHAMSHVRGAFEG